MAPDTLVVSVYVALALAVVFLPLKWSLIAYVLLSTVDFGQKSEHIGLLNAGKAIALPLYLLWRLRKYSGHKELSLAAISWILLTIYATIGAFWSLYPVFALKLTGHMIASFVICCVFLRASKGGLVDPAMVLPVTIGIMAIAGLRSIFAPTYGEEAVRFTTFSTAQSFGALLVALYCIVLGTKTLRPALRISLCVVMAIALVFDGSRIWALGLITATLFALMLSDVRSWAKYCALGLVVVIATTIVGSSDKVVGFLSEHAGSNRIAAAVAAAYEGDMISTGLGTFRFRRNLSERVVDQIRKSSPVELMIGHGTSSGITIAGSHTKGLDANRFFHDEWLRVIYEWGFIGLCLFVLFIGSLATYAFRGTRRDSNGYARPLLIYMPALLFGLSGENIIAGAGNAVSVGFLLLVAMASIAHRRVRYPNVMDPPREAEARHEGGRVSRQDWMAARSAPTF